MNIRLRKNWLFILAEREVPQHRNCWSHEFMINYDGYWSAGAAPRGGGGGGGQGANPPMIFLFFCLSAQRAVMSMMIIINPPTPLCSTPIFVFGEKMCRSPPPPPLSLAFSSGLAGLS